MCLFCYRYSSHFLASISLLLQFLASYSDDLMLFLFLEILNSQQTMDLFFGAWGGAGGPGVIWEVF